MWDETLGARRGNEVASCILKWGLRYLNSETKSLTIWSDNCTGQNRNILIALCYSWLVTKISKLDVIKHKFMLKGLTHLDVVHAAVEQKEKELKDFEIMIPHDWEQFIRTIKIKNKYLNVDHLAIEDFKNFVQLVTEPDSSMVVRHTD